MHGSKKVPNFDMEALKTFFIVVKCHSFSEAAELLHKTPATISYRIKALEDQVGMPLFRRSTRTVELLPAGEHLMEFATQIYGLLQEIPRNLEQLSIGAELQFTITVNNLLYSEKTMVELIQLLHEKFPVTQITVERAVYMGVWDSLISRRADLAIGVPTWHPIANDMETHPLGEVRWVFAIAPSHPLASKDGVLTNNDLLAYPAINIQDTAVNLAKRTAWRLVGQKEIIVPDISTKLECHLKGLGVGFLPETLAKPYLKSGRLLTCQVDHPRKPSPMAVAWRQDSDGAVRRFITDLFEQRHPVAENFKAFLHPATS